MPLQIVGPHKQESPHPEGFNLFQVLVGSSRFVSTVGIGWDTEHPLRPWPKLSTMTLPNTQAKYTCLSLCGLFAGFGWV